jgi:hypothetical protein
MARALLAALRDRLRFSSLEEVVMRAFPLVLALGVSATALAAPPVAPPGAKGAYDVGTTTFFAVMSDGRSTKVQAYYPTAPQSSSACDTYTVSQGNLGTYHVSSPLCAHIDAPIADGAFPLIVMDHGGGAAGADFQRLNELPIFETLASHGFVVACALHSAVLVVRIHDMSVLIDRMLERYSGSVDPTRIGIWGYSAGGQTALSVAAGRPELGIAPDPRPRAMVVFEPGVGPNGVPPADLTSLAIPYLVMGGDEYASGLAVPGWFPTTTLAVPRIYVFTEGAVHMNYNTEQCPLLDEAREQALLADPTLPEPLTYPPAPVAVAANAPAAAAFFQWNNGQINNGGSGFGNGRNWCNQVGLGPARPLDADGDGFTDSPPFVGAEPIWAPKGAIPWGIMAPMVRMYTVAFWEVFLAGDGRYMPYLTPGYAHRNGLPAVVDIEGD